jgi:Uncharacterised nucleotidyltransferase
VASRSGRSKRTTDIRPAAAIIAHATEASVGGSSASGPADICRLLCRALAAGPPEAAIRTRLREPTTLEAVMRLAAQEHLLPALSQAVARQFPADIPKAPRAVLAIEYAANERRNRLIRDLVLELGSAAQRRGIELVALKGCQWLLEDEEALAAWRWMLDIDVLVEPANYDAVPAVLAELGWAATADRNQLFGRRRARDHYHLPPHARGNLPVFIEVHRHIGWRPNLLPTELIFAHRRTVAPGLAVAEPWHAAFHSLVHWQVQHGGLRRLQAPLRNVFELVRYLERDDVDLIRLIAHAEAVGLQRELNAASAFAVELFDVRLPASLVPGAAARRHVARCLAIRGSPALAWIARERGRILAMWDCKRATYRLFLRGAGPERTAAALCAQRLIRLPLMLLSGLYLAVVGSAKLAYENVHDRRTSA